MLNSKIKFQYLFILVSILSLFVVACVPQLNMQQEKKSMPTSYLELNADSTNSATLNWRKIFADTNLVALIDTALKNNQELNIIMQEVEMSKNEIEAKKGEYLPFVNFGLVAGAEKPARYTRNGAVEEALEISSNKRFPEPLGNFIIGPTFSWEVDIWKKLRNAKKSALIKYLASIEGKNFMLTNLISEIATSYYELLALDNHLNIIQQNMEIQHNALLIVQQQKEATKVSQLAVNRFEALLLNTKNLQYDVKQDIIKTENKINFLIGDFPQPVKRDIASFNNIKLDSIYAGVPSQLLMNRADVRQAEQQLIAAAKMDIKVARANFYPSLRIEAGVAFQAFSPSVWFSPESILYGITGNLVAPLINRKALKANYRNANAKQIQAVYNYEKSILTAYVDVVNQLSAVKNYSNSYDTKFKEVDILTHSVDIASNLFNSARADYMEVLLTQREALQTKMENIDIKAKLFSSKIALYKALGGGWK